MTGSSRITTDCVSFRTTYNRRNDRVRGEVDFPQRPSGRGSRVPSVISDGIRYPSDPGLMTLRHQRDRTQRRTVKQELGRD